MDADAIVVGAGPAGSAAAITLAHAGWRTLLLDRAAFPRDKPCGDLLGVHAVRWARRLGVTEADLAPYTPLRGALIVDGAQPIDLVPPARTGRRTRAPGDARVIPRAVFDAALVQAAMRAGAEVRRLAVRRVSRQDGDGRTVTGDGEAGQVALRARAVIVAGGYGCRVAPEQTTPGRAGNEPARGVAMRGYFSGVSAPAGRMIVALEHRLLPGYGWLFPLPDGGANVGVGTLTGSGGAHLHDLYERFTRDPGSPAARWLRDAYPVGPPRAWPLDLGPRGRVLTGDGLLITGEAAGLVGPLTGAGISFALASGAWAGATLAGALAEGDVRRARLAGYERFVKRRITPQLRAEAAVQRWLTNPARLRATLRAVRPLPFTPTLGARLLLHLG